MNKILLLISVVLFATACKKDRKDIYQSQGTIIGYDNRACAMCGGLEISILNDTAKNPPNFYLYNGDLPQLGISAGTPFPINISLNWQHEPPPRGGYNYILISKVKVNK